MLHAVVPAYVCLNIQNPKQYCSSRPRPSFIAFLFVTSPILAFSSDLVVTLNRRPLTLDLDGQHTQPGPTYTSNPIPCIGECKIVNL
jgi:hypothetical protein